MKKRIGLVPLFDSALQSVWMLGSYTAAVEASGAVPLILPLTGDEAALESALSACGGLLVTGGQDCDPRLYGEAPLPACGPVCPARDRMETVLLRLSDLWDLPVLGICRGVQSMNAVFGGTLYQDLPTQRPSSVCHRQKRPYGAPAHLVSLSPDAPLRALLRRETLPVNSLHHQAVRALAPGFCPAAVSEDGLTEAIYRPGRRFFLGVQWHPEFLAPEDEASRTLFAAFAASLRA